MPSPMQLTKEALKKAGIPCAVAEHWNSFANIRQDLFGFIDLVALGPGIRAIQVTTDEHYAAHKLKIIENRSALHWLRQGGKIEVWSWGKHGDRGKRKLWKVKVYDFTEADFLFQGGEEDATTGEHEKHTTANGES